MRWSTGISAATIERAIPALLPVPKILTGRGAAALLPAEALAIAGKGRRAALIIDSGLRGPGPASSAASALAAELELAVIEQPQGEPSAAHADAAAEAIRAHRAGAVIAIGGGSALDTAKLAAAASAGPRSAGAYAFCAEPLPSGGPPVIAVPTTAGTGSETTTTCVFRNGAGKKAWAWGPELAARLAILDPELTVSLPPGLTAATGLDALVHALEACTNRNRFGANDIYCHQALGLIPSNLATAVREPLNIDAREAMLLASCLAGIGINNAGTAMAHAAAHALGSLGNIHHGRAAALGLRASIAWSIGESPGPYAAAAAALGGPRDAAALPEIINLLIRGCGLDTNLARDLPGVTAEALAGEMARPENSSMRNANARQASGADLLAIARNLLEA